MSKNYTVEELREIAKNGKHIPIKKAFDIMTKAHEEQRKCIMLFKVNEKSYEKWYNKAKKYLSTIEDETLYIVYQNNKAFGNYGGYSIFGTSLGQKLRNNWPYDMCDRIENCKLEYAIMVEEQQ